MQLHRSKILNTKLPDSWKKIPVFPVLWLLTIIVYLPAARAGWVIDAAGWLHNVRTQPLAKYLNRAGSSTHSLYQFTQFITWVFYQLWGSNTWLWSLLFSTLHACNAYLLFLFCQHLFLSVALKRGRVVALLAALLFCLSPYASEVVIWKACYHYLQGTLFIFLILYWVQRYRSTYRMLYPALSVCVFVLSAFSLELFYVTPLLVFCLGVFYRVCSDDGRLVFVRILRVFVLPQLVILAVYVLIFSLVYGGFTPHVANLFSQHFTDYASKPLKYLFHILLLGRFFDMHGKEMVYGWCESTPVLVVCYLSVFCVFAFMTIRLKTNKAVWLMMAFSVVALALLMPLSFPGAALLVFYDRYCYFASAFIYPLLALLVFSVFRSNFAQVLLLAYLGIGLAFTIRLNGYWKKSAYINNRLVLTYPRATNKISILLNVPENYVGVPMIGSDPDGAFKGFYNLFADTPTNGVVYDAISYNLNTMDDGAHVLVLNDSMVRVTLNQWGTWWWYSGHGGTGYSNKDYSINMIDGGHMYELTLKHPYAQYQLLFEHAANWTTVDMKKRDGEQY